MTTKKPYRVTADALRARFGDAPKGAIILGSGMGSITDVLDPLEGHAPYGEIGLPVTGVVGHRGNLSVGMMAGERIAILGGRVHLYEGRDVEETVRAVRALAVWGVEKIVLTSAVGCIDPKLHPGMLIRITDHVNHQFQNVLTGPNDPDLGPRFPDMTFAHDKVLGQAVAAAAKDIGIDMPTAIYAATPGPSYETPAEIQMFRLLECGVVGMSLAAEITGAVHAGLRCTAISTVSNYGAGIVDEALSHDDVTKVVGKAASTLTRLLIALVQRW